MGEKFRQEEKGKKEHNEFVKNYSGMQYFHFDQIKRNRNTILSIFMNIVGHCSL